jgi:hypothetical protein
MQLLFGLTVLLADNGVLVWFVAVSHRGAECDTSVGNFDATVAIFSLMCLISAALVGGMARRPWRGGCVARRGTPLGSTITC